MTITIIIILIIIILVSIKTFLKMLKSKEVKQLILRRLWIQVMKKWCYKYNSMINNNV